MEKAKLKGEIQTGLGLIEADDFGVVLLNKHLFVDNRNYFIEPSQPGGKELARQPVSLGNISWVRSHKTSNLDNLQLTDEETAISEVIHFKKAGGSTVVDLTPNNIGHNPSGLGHVSRATGLNVIMATAYHVEQSYSTEMHMDSRTEKDIDDEFVRDITGGVGDNRVPAGVLGELSCSWPLINNERNVLRAAIVAISIHHVASEDEPIEIVKVLTDAGADPIHIIIGYMSRSIASHSDRCKLAETGCYLEFYMFGNDGLYPPADLSTTLDLPNNLGRIRQIIQLIAEGYLNQFLISQDVCFKVLLSCLGVGDYSHILTTIIPFMRQKGIVEDQIQALIVENPRRVLI